MTARVDARAKADGSARYVADLDQPGMLWVAFTRSIESHARIAAIDPTDAAESTGVVAVVTGKDLGERMVGRHVRDVPLLAHDRVRFQGERVAAVLAETREQAERAALLVDVEYEELPAVVTADEALADGAPLVHEAPWDYEGAFVKAEDGANLHSAATAGSLEAVHAALDGSAHVVRATYHTPSIHHGYIEPHATLAAIEGDGQVSVWTTCKAPFRGRDQIAATLDVEPARVTMHPVLIGGDFGGKGDPIDGAMCAALARHVGRPVKYVARYGEELTASNPRHPSTIGIEVGCDADGVLTALSLDVLLNGGAYAGYKPSPHWVMYGATGELCTYRIPQLHTACRVAYTHTVPRGHMRAPGSCQTVFALESALDELAAAAGLEPAELRRRNLLHTGDTDPYGTKWIEYRGEEVLEAALAAYTPVDVPEGTCSGTGISIYSRESASSTSTSLRLVPLEGGRLRVEVPTIETGTGSHTVAARAVARSFGIDPELVEVSQVGTDRLPLDPIGAGASIVTAGLVLAIDKAAEQTGGMVPTEPLEVRTQMGGGADLGSVAVQVAQVAVDPETGAVEILQIVTAVDVADVVNPTAHRMQLDGGTAMGVGMACLEDLAEADGQVWAANLGDYKLPSVRDLPVMTNVLVRGSTGVGSANVKAIGEMSTPPTAAAIANAIADATGARVRSLPLSAERVLDSLEETR